MDLGTISLHAERRLQFLTHVKSKAGKAGQFEIVVNVLMHNLKKTKLLLPLKMRTLANKSQNILASKAALNFSRL